LVRILSKDKIMIESGFIKRHLDRYAGHLDRIVIDSYGIIVDIKLNELLSILDEKNLYIVKSQIAHEIKRLRINDSAITSKDKIVGYNELINSIENAYAKFNKH
jgi:hypothetical protein